MLRILIALAVAGLTTFLISDAQAKGPLEMEVSGGDLEAPVHPDGQVNSIDVFPLSDGAYLDTPADTSGASYTLTFYVPDGGEAVFTLTYYAARGDQPALLRDADGFYPASATLTAMVEPVLPASATVTAESGGGTSIVWYIAPVIAAMVVLAAAGGMVLRRRSREVTVPA
jgi:hypothetical protein